MKWTVVIPVKGVPAAKSRLSPAVPDDARAMLARAFALDTIAAALGARSVARVIVVGADPSLAGGAEFLLEPEGAGEGGARGLLPAVRHGIAQARLDAQDVAVAVLLGDLPALQSDELDAALDAAVRHPLAFVRDADGSGTTLATAGPGVPFEPRFGADSAAQHAAAGFVELEASATPGLTRDVDTVDALEAVLHHGVGDHTAEAVAHLADRKGTP